MLIYTLLYVIIHKNVDAKVWSSSLSSSPLSSSNEVSFQCVADVDCDDENICTDDICDRIVGCINKNNNNGCDSGDFCTVNDICNNGVCTSGSDKECDDANQCTDDSCNPASGCINENNNNACNDGNPCSENCINANNDNACDDGDACTTDDKCSNGLCGGMDVDCNDNNQCTDDKCDATTGNCINANNDNACDDGDICT
eukprot:199117_1